MDLNKSSSVENLANAEWIAKVEGGVEKDLKGLEYGGEFHVNCMNCEQELMTVMKISDNPSRFPIGLGKYVEVQEQRFKAVCPFCNNSSWTVRVNGTIMVGPIDEKTCIVDYIYGDPKDPDGMLNEVEIIKA